MKFGEAARLDPGYARRTARTHRLVTALALALLALTVIAVARPALVRVGTAIAGRRG